MVLLVTSFFLCLLFWFSVSNLRDDFRCDLDEENQHMSHICKELRKHFACKRGVASPLKAEIILNINNSVKASASVSCGWEIAVSEIRISLIIVSFLIMFVGLKAIDQLSRKFTENFSFYCNLLSIVFMVTSFFDLIAIYDSVNDNYSLCNLIDDFKIDDGIQVEA